jgi:hypothetical protein
MLKYLRETTAQKENIISSKLSNIQDETLIFAMTLNLLT